MPDTPALYSIWTQKMAQRLILNKAPFKIEMIIGDDELVVFEFQEFWEKVKLETNVSIDTYSGRVIKKVFVREQLRGEFLNSNNTNVIEIEIPKNINKNQLTELKKT